MIFGFNKEELRKKRLSKRKKYLLALVARLVERKSILDIERDEVEKEITKTRNDLVDVLKRGGINGWYRGIKR